MSKTKHEMDMQYLQGNLKIDPVWTRVQTLRYLRDEHKLNTTSWVLDALAEEWGMIVEDVRTEYKKLLDKDALCEHGFLVDENNSCPYCKYGTE